MLDAATDWRRLPKEPVNWKSWMRGFAARACYTARTRSDIGAVAMHSLSHRKMSVEQRSFRRAPCRRHVLLRNAGQPGTAAQAVAVDLSPNGFCLHTPVLFPLHAAVEVELAAETGPADPSAALRGRVVWGRALGQGWACGVRLWMRPAPGSAPRPTALKNRDEAQLLLDGLQAQLLEVPACTITPLAEEGFGAVGGAAAPPCQPPPGRASRLRRTTRRAASLLFLLLLLLGARQLSVKDQTAGERGETSAFSAGAGLPSGLFPISTAHAIEPASSSHTLTALTPLDPLLTTVPASRGEVFQSGLAAAEYALHAVGPEFALPLFDAVLARAGDAPRHDVAARLGMAEALLGTGQEEAARRLLRATPSVARELPVEWAAWAASMRHAGEDVLAPRATLELAGAIPPLGEVAPVQIVVQLDEYLLQVQQDGLVVATFPVGLGMDGRTPRGQFTIANKLEHPTWFHKGTGVPPDDPANPLGAYWMGLGRHGRATSYGIHPTDEAASIGKARSQGCIRMRPEDAAMLFQWCEIGTPVTIR